MKQGCPYFTCVLVLLLTVLQHLYSNREGPATGTHWRVSHHKERVGGVGEKLFYVILCGVVVHRKLVLHIVRAWRRWKYSNQRRLFKETWTCAHSWIGTHLRHVGSAQSSQWFGPRCTQVSPRWAGQLCWSRGWQTGGEGGWADPPSQLPWAWQWHRPCPARCLLCTGSSPRPPEPAGWWAGLQGFDSSPVWRTWLAGRSSASAAQEEAPQSCCTRTWLCFPGRGTLSLGAGGSLEGLMKAGNKAMTYSGDLLHVFYEIKGTLQTFSIALQKRERSKTRSTGQDSLTFGFILHFP